MASKISKNSKGTLFTLSLVAVLILSVFVATGSDFNLGSRAARSKAVENGTLVLATQSECNLGNYALIAQSGECNSVVARNVDSMLGSRVKVVGILRDGILYAESVTFLSKNTSPTATPRFSTSPSIRPSSYPLPTCYPKPRCLSDIVPCLVVEPADGWCETPTPDGPPDIIR